MKKFLKILFTQTEKLSVDDQITKRTFWSFLIFFALAGIAILGWSNLRNARQIDHVQKPIRKVLNTNEKIFKNLISNKHLAKTYPREKAAKKARVNGHIGLKSTLDSAGWRLRVAKLNGDTLFLSLDDIKKLPKIEYTFNFKCIEGWSQISNWGGVRFSEFAKHYGLDPEIQKKYMGLYTPDSEYYVGIDMASALHPQTILCYELNGKPLPLDQGYPLRLIIPIKYGVKSLKRIGTIYFSDEPPPDYWAERGYDYFIGL